MNRAGFAARLSVPETEIASASADTSAKWACRKLATALDRACLYRETNVAGFYYEGWVDPDALEATIGRALALLRERLGD
jgi:hypothetical protein